ncbi:MAG: ribosomal L7Ae/L30e/S12e/Gadd45 family protein [Eubacteriales bacterium]|nr:ribosomal L7Ae/L30e/S12e/Gadd45 family protein [Eubacteriales bacterium]
MRPNKVFSLLGLATRAGRTASGEFMTEKAVKDGSARLVIVGTDASANTKKNFCDMCRFYKVPYYEYGTKAELGHAMGKEMRASLAVTDDGFARTLKQHLEASMKEVVEWQK